MATVDSETLFNGAAAVVSTIAVAVFVLNVEFGYSPVSKVVLVVAFLTGVLAITQREGNHQLRLFGYGVIVTSVVMLFFDLVDTFTLGDGATAVGLLVIAGTLFALKSKLDADNRFLSARTARYLFAAVAVVAVGVLLVDVVTGTVTHELQPRAEIEYAGDDTVQVASLVVTNPTPLPERVEAPQYRVCTAGNWSAYRRATEPGEPPRPVDAEVHARVGYEEYLLGYSTERYPVALHLGGSNLQGERFAVEVTDGCPDVETGAPYLALFSADRDHRYGEPV